MNKRTGFILPLVMLFTGKLFAQPLELSSIFGNNMVLQQGIKVPVWGTGKPNEEITIAFAGKKQKTKVDAVGNWMVTYPN